MREMSWLMTGQEMRERYEKREDSFDLTVEKWSRLRDFIETASTLRDFEELLQAAIIPVPFCFKYQPSCQGCPLEKTCSRGRGEKFQRTMRLIQAYALAGDRLPKEILISEIDDFLLELEMIRAESKGMVH